MARNQTGSKRQKKKNVARSRRRWRFSFFVNSSIGIQSELSEIEANETFLMNLFCLRVLFVKRKDLSLDRRFPRACVEKAFSAICTYHYDNRYSGVFLDPSPLLFKKNQGGPDAATCA
jgi:hypothetical protein